MKPCVQCYDAVEAFSAPLVLEMKKKILNKGKKKNQKHAWALRPDIRRVELSFVVPTLAWV